MQMHGRAKVIRRQHPQAAGDNTVKSLLSLAAFALASLLVPSVVAQQAAVPAAPALTPSGHPNNPYWQQHDRLLLTDFAFLARFKEEDLKLGAPAAGENRIVFMGDSITQGWHLADSFPGKPYINRGISGQTTPQMVLRFHQDVVNLKPKAVIILAGTNDLAGNTGPMTPEETENNIAAMAEIASSNGIKVILCSILPAFDFPWAPGLEPAPKVVAINRWIKAYAAQKGHLYVDYYSAMKDARGGLPPTLSHDGVHPLPAGYAVMAPLAEAAIEQAIK